MKRLDRRAGRTVARWTIAAAFILVAVPVVAHIQFSDVSEDHPRRADIDFVADRGAFQGYSDGTFRPERNITPEQMTTVLGRAFPGGMTRAVFASMLRNGYEQAAPTPTDDARAADYDARAADYDARDLPYLAAMARHAARAARYAADHPDRFFYASSVWSAGVAFRSNIGTYDFDAKRIVFVAEAAAEAARTAANNANLSLSIEADAAEAGGVVDVAALRAVAEAAADAADRARDDARALEAATDYAALFAADAADYADAVADYVARYVADYAARDAADYAARIVAGTADYPARYAAAAADRYAVAAAEAARSAARSGWLVAEARFIAARALEAAAEADIAATAARSFADRYAAR